jgi:flagellar motor switch protein FliN
MENDVLTEGNESAADDQWQAENEAMSGEPGTPANSPEDTQSSGITAPTFQSLSNSNSKPNTSHDIDLILDIPVQLTVELGRTKVPIKSILQMGQGSVVELDAVAGDPLDVSVNGCLIAQGEVVVVNDKFGIRLTDIITPSERMKKLKR